MENDNRYFFVTHSHSRGFGSLRVDTTGGIYINEASIVKALEQDGVTGVVILNIIEMSKDDYDQYKKTLEDIENGNL